MMFFLLAVCIDLDLRTGGIDAGASEQVTEKQCSGSNTLFIRCSSGTGGL